MMPSTATRYSARLAARMATRSPRRRFRARRAPATAAVRSWMRPPGPRFVPRRGVEHEDPVPIEGEIDEVAQVPAFHGRMR